MTTKASGDLGNRKVVPSSRVRGKERRAKTGRVVIVLSLFLLLIAAALLVGGRALIDPTPHTAAQAREDHRLGDVVFTMPDGSVCRHMAFDNRTGDLTETAVAQCPEARPRSLSESGDSFSWSQR
jgi:hypothetical protein